MIASRVPTASLAKVTPEVRRKLSRRDFAHLMLDQEGRCSACAEKLNPDAIIDEHLVPLDQGGSNKLSNRALFCRGCARVKTYRDLAASAHGKRVRGEKGQRKRQALRRAGKLKRRSFPTNRDQRWKKTLAGEVVRREARPRRRRRLPYDPK